MADVRSYVYVLLGARAVLRMRVAWVQSLTAVCWEDARVAVFMGMCVTCAHSFNLLNSNLDSDWKLDEVALTRRADSSSCAPIRARQ